MFIINLTYLKPLEEVEKFLPEHVEYLDYYYENGHFIASGRQVPRVGGVILAKADSKDEIKAIIRHDPFYREHIARYDITEFVPSKYAKSLKVLVEAE